MALCPICNSLQQLERYCSKCSSILEDSGKVSDFLDPYGHYNDEETVKMGDGYSNTAKEEICPHLLYCNNCGHQEVMFVEEKELGEL